MLKPIALVLAVSAALLVGVETADASDRWVGPGWYAFECLFAGCFALGGPFEDETTCAAQLQEDTEYNSYVCADIGSRKEFNEAECAPFDCEEPAEQ